MQKFTQKYTIICLLEEIEEGYEYPSDRWPLHTTLADTFAITVGIEELKGLLDEISQNAQAASTTAIQNEYFGDDKSIKVTVFEKNDSIKNLHYKVINALEQLGVTFNDPQYMKDGFKPHATAQKHSEIKIGDSVIINNLAIVDMFPNEDAYQRKIIKKVMLG